MFRPKKNKIKEQTIEDKPTEAVEVKEPEKEQDDKVTMKETKNPRVKRIDTNQDGFLIEKKEVSIHFVPNEGRTFKNSHGPNEGKNQYNQNTQRLDKLLDKFLDKNDMDMMGEPNSRSMITMKKFKHKNVNNAAQTGNHKTVNNAAQTGNQKTVNNALQTGNHKTEHDEKGDFLVNSNDAKNKRPENYFLNNNNNRKIQHLSVEDNFKLLDDQIAKSKMLNEHYSKNSQQTDLDSLQEFMNSHGGATKAKTKLNSKGQITSDHAKKENVLILGNADSTTQNYNLLMSISTMLYKE